MDKKKIKELVQNKKNLFIIVIGVLGIILLFVSEMTGKDVSEKNEQDDNVTIEQLQLQTEKKLTELISSIDGAGQTKVMISLDSDGENSFAIDKSFDKSVNERSTEISNDENYVVINRGSGSEGLKIKTVAPCIRGVAVVCEGGGDSVVKREITETVSAALGIGREKIYIAKMNTTNFNGGRK